LSLISVADFWSKAENAASWTSPEIGNPVTPQGTINYSPCKFNNGSYNTGPAIAVNYLYGSNIISNLNSFIYEEWIKTDFSVNSGVADNGKQNGRFGIFQDNNNILYSTFHNSGTWGLYTLVKTQGVQYNIAMKSAAITFAAGSLNHIFTVFNPNGIAGGSDTLRVYLNGSLVGSSAISFNAFPNNNNIFYFNCIRGTSNIAYPSNMLIDNVKIYNSTSQETIDQIIANRNNEGWPVDGYPNASRFNNIRGIASGGSL